VPYFFPRLHLSLLNIKQVQYEVEYQQELLPWLKRQSFLLWSWDLKFGVS
jgi:hypothetical protein